MTTAPEITLHVLLAMLRDGRVNRLSPSGRVLLDQPSTAKLMEIAADWLERQAYELARAEAGRDAQIKHMVGRFLQWKLPENFNPDGGISFERDCNANTPWPSKREPVGTNLLDATQAEAMVRFMVSGCPAPGKLADAPSKKDIP